MHHGHPSVREPPQASPDHAFCGSQGSAPVEVAPTFDARSAKRRAVTEQIAMTKYDYNRTQELTKQRTATLAKMREVVEGAKAAGRDPNAAEQAALVAAETQVKGLDAELKEQNAAMLKAVLGRPANYDSDHSSTEYLSLRTPGFASDLAAHFGKALGTPGMKALIDTADPYTSIPMDPTPYRIESTPNALLESLPAVNRGVVYRYMRQTTQTNNAAPVAAGALKPTSAYGLEPVDGRLRVIAHVSEPMDKYVLQDGPSLTQFVQMEMVDGLHRAVEVQLLSGDGLGENITGIANVSGIQTQAYNTDPILTARTAITKVESLGYTPAFFVLSPTDWEAVETQQLSAGQFVLNAEGSRNGVPVDSATRRLWGTPVTVSTGVTAGTGYLLSNGVAQVATDGRIDTEWSSAIGDDFQRNSVRLRCEGRFDLTVTRPMGVVKMTLTGV